ncbi:VPLPA-CTERM sorting domain-containing protein [uncultured Roseobacter sp.]|uniref:VPLPA-CTERM sorting domain-containing protein n=1 Tax=uncultured Roseobacter sp. TaxID=114847 RepID=UPI00261E929C|nr:VPLPA-CTERM sorting domain-containing protein [uncultured Roseobacter sp.]
MDCIGKPEMKNRFYNFCTGLVCALGLSAGGASASTLDDVILGDLIFSADTLDVIADDFYLEAFGISNDNDDIFVSALLESGAVDSTLASDVDLSIFDTTFTEILGGTALDVEVDADADTISILYDLAINEESSDPFGVAILFFGIDLTDGILNFAGDLDGEIVDLDIFGAADPAVIPLPAGLPLFIGGLTAFAWLRSRKTA